MKRVQLEVPSSGTQSLVPQPIGVPNDAKDFNNEVRESKRPTPNHLTCYLDQCVENAEPSKHSQVL